MGIHGLNNIIKKANPNAYQTCNYQEFAGHTLAMDVSIFLHKYVHTDRHTWFSAMVNFFIKMKKAKIDIVAIFDGDHVPIEKFLERDNRRLNADKLKDKIQNAKSLEDILRINYTTDTDYSHTVSEEHQDRVCALLKLEKDTTKIDLESPEMCIRELQNLQDRIANQCEKVGAHHTEQMIRLVNALGVPWLKAYGEAEALCASLAYHGYVDGVLSRDTDSLVYGTPLFVCEFKQDAMTWTTLDVVLDSLDLNMKQFIDLCIMCGCDYNTNIPKIGALTAFKKISQYGSIEEYERAEGVDTTCLRYKRCREIFVPYSKVYLEGYTIPFKRKPDEGELYQVFRDNDCRIRVDYVMNLWEPPQLDFCDEDLDS